MVITYPCSQSSRKGSPQPDRAPARAVMAPGQMCNKLLHDFFVWKCLSKAPAAPRSSSRSIAASSPGKAGSFPRATRTTGWPDSARRCDSALPMPLLAPVTRTIRVFMVVFFVLSSAQGSTIQHPQWRAEVNVGRPENSHLLNERGRTRFRSGEARLSIGS